MWYFSLCDDEPAQLSWLEKAVMEWAAERKCQVHVDLYESAEQFLFSLEEKGEMDIVILDVSMPGMSGISLARRLRERKDPVQIIFVTGLADYALEGYDVEAVSYLVKPVKKEQFFSCLDRAAERSGKKESVLLLDTADGIWRVRTSDICFLESAAHDTLVRCIHLDAPVRCKTGIHQLEDHISALGEAFFKIHRSYLVNLACVSMIGKKEAVMDTGERLPVARGRWEALNQAYLEYYRGTRDNSDTT